MSESPAKLRNALAQWALLVLLATGSGFSLFVYDASVATDRARDGARAIMLVQDRFDDAALERAYAQTLAPLAQAWSRPLAWSPDALETQSWVLAQRAGHDPNAAAQALTSAERSARAAPMQTLSWMRVAGFSLRGAQSELCTPRTCLANAYRAAPMLSEDLACDRLRLAHLAGERFLVGDPRLDAYLAATPSTQRLRQCLNFLDARTLYATLLRAHASGRL